ncbi:MAG: TetR/AcrR family transcriptional regulator [Nocardia sp.]|nr:TetR/AcrR family transcriptional regulator [Nocardia sp.]
MTTTASERPVRARAAHLGPERRRPQVLDAARAVALRDGVGAVTIGSVADELGVTRPVVYSCFGHRVEMVDALLERDGRALLDSLISALHQSGGTDDPERAFINGFRAFLAVVAQQAEPWRLIVGSDPDPAVVELFREARAIIRREVTSWIGPAMHRWWQTEDLDGKLPVLVDLFMASCESAADTLLKGRVRWTVDELGEFVGRAVHRMFRDA